MKRLAVMRHAKSSWDEPALADFDRPLNARGRTAASAIGRELVRRGLDFDAILASPAKRVGETLALLSEAGIAQPVRFEPDLYLAAPDRLFGFLRDLPETARSALLAGHNPGLQQFLLQLARDDQAGNRDRIAAKLPTAAFVMLSTDIERWADADRACATIELLLLPRELSESAVER